MAVEVNTTYLGTAVFIKLFNFKMRLIQIWAPTVLLLPLFEKASSSGASQCLKNRGGNAKN